MADLPILMPQLGESIAEAAVLAIKIAPGDAVAADQEIMEVETNKAVMSVTTPKAGIIREIRAIVDESYPIGAHLATLECESVEQAAKASTTSTPTMEASTPQIPAAPRTGNAPGEIAAAASATDRPHFATDTRNGSGLAMPEEPSVQPTVQGLPVPANATGASYISPRMRSRMDELGFNASDLAGIAGSGAGGRVTVDDFEKYLSRLEEHHLTDASPMRIAVADSMRRSWSRPLATVGSPVVLDPILIHRKSQTKKAGPALYVLRALALAIAENTAIGGRLVGERIVHPNSIDIGFAVEVPDGVLVPVIENADRHTLSELVDKYTELVDLARKRRLPKESLKPGIATVTNFGSFGIVWATPIPLPEQNLVLGLGVGRKKPVWSSEVDAFIPVTEAEITLSFDHRILDGGGAGRLLARVSELLGEPEKL
jgi:pyruvate/2-oxoglutarate dehydrogenase complex dihydrolipoamide acyltransferase (E2) component